MMQQYGWSLCTACGQSSCKCLPSWQSVFRDADSIHTQAVLDRLKGLDKPKKKRMSPLYKKNLTPELKKLVEAGLLDEDLYLTNLGRAHLEAILVVQYNVELTAAADTIIAERAAKK